MKKIRRLLIILASILLTVAILSNVGLLLVDTFGYHHTGGVVTRISARSRGDGAFLLKIKYVTSTGGYSVREVPEDEGEYCGDGMHDYNGSLGKYRILISFGDAEPSMLQVAKFIIAEEPNLNGAGVPLKMKIASPSDHGFVLYIGSDTPLHVQETKGELNALGGTLRIPVELSEDS